MTPTISRVSRMKRAGVFMLCAALTVTGLLFSVQTHNTAYAKTAKKKPAIKAKAEGEFRRANFKLIMHQVYENYYQATQAVQNKEPKLTEAFLTVLAFYVDELGKNFPDTDYKGNPVDEKEFSQAVGQLKKEVRALRSQAKQRKLTSLEDPEKALASTCLLCHDSVVFSSKLRPAP